MTCRGHAPSHVTCNQIRAAQQPSQQETACTHSVVVPCDRQPAYVMSLSVLWPQVPHNISPLSIAGSWKISRIYLICKAASSTRCCLHSCLILSVARYYTESYRCTGASPPVPENPLQWRAAPSQSNYCPNCLLTDLHGAELGQLPHLLPGPPDTTRCMADLQAGWGHFKADLLVVRYGTDTSSSGTFRMQLRVYYNEAMHPSGIISAESVGRHVYGI